MFSGLKVDRFSLGLVAAVLLATFFPVSGSAAATLSLATKAAIAAMFFFYGVRLAREALVTALGHWRLHMTVLAMTYGIFPMLGLVINAVTADHLPDDLRLGLMFLCFLPSTVQSSIAFTSLARGNIPAAVCAASLSNLLGVFITPLLVGVFIHAASQGFSFESLTAIVMQLLVPFLGGQFMRPLLGAWAGRQQRWLNMADRGAILLIVYGAFSAAIISGLWQKLSGDDILILIGIVAALLAVILWATTYLSRWLGFSREDEIAIVFCGSKKSLATGIPMAGILFSATSLGFVVLPLMLFHQLQLLACAVLAQRYASRKSG